MDKDDAVFIPLNPEDREAYFTTTAERAGLSSVIIEKDYWVCRTLYHLFSIPDAYDHLIFKGGTSLSKVYGLINRFSEDVDLAITREMFGFSGKNDPLNIEGKNARRRAVEELGDQCSKYIQETILPELINYYSDEIISPEKKIYIDPEDKQTILFDYPTGLDDKEYSSYIKPTVKIEMGARSDHHPFELCDISTFVNESFPENINHKVNVRVLSAARTFWEKATILHAEYHRPEPQTRERLSRHYYDLVMIARSTEGTKALDNIRLLEEVAKHKDAFYPAGWANYDQARAGTLKLSPHEDLEKILRKDYQAMTEMFFDDPPEFDVLLTEINSLEEKINNIE